MFQIFITYDRNLLCGGTLITLDLVLTAAHCFVLGYSNQIVFTRSLYNLRVVAGITDRTDNDGIQCFNYNLRRRIWELTMHEEFMQFGDNIDNDIALLRVSVVNINIVIRKYKFFRTFFFLCLFVCLTE